MIDPSEHLRPDIPNVEHHGQHIAECLDYVAKEAEQIGLSFSAHLIRMAASAVRDAVALSQRSNRNARAA